MTTSVIGMADFRDRQAWQEARLLTAVLHQVSDSFPSDWSVRIRNEVQGLLVALTNPDERLAMGEGRRRYEKLAVDLQNAFRQQLIDPTVYKRLQEQTTIIESLLKQKSTS